MIGRRAVPYRHSRRDLGGGAGGTFDPLDISGNDLWMLASRGRTDVVASIADPNDITTANWTKTSGTAVDATTFQDTLDGVPTIHSVRQTPSNMRINHVAYYSFEVKAGTITQLQVQCGAGDSFVNIDLSAGTFLGGTFETRSIQAQSDGWFRVEFTGISSGNILWFIPMVGGTTSYTGTGTGRFQVRNVACRQITVTQWLDQSPYGQLFSQGTSANQPVFVPELYNGQPGIRFHRAATDWFGNSAGAITAHWTGSDVAHTVAYAGRFRTTGAFNNIVLSVDHTAGSGWEAHYNSGTAISQFRRDDAGVNVTAAVSAVVDTSRHAWVIRFNGTTTEYFKDGVSLGAPIAADVGVLTANQSSIGAQRPAGVVASPADLDLAELLGYARALTDDEIRLLSQYLLRFG